MLIVLHLEQKLQEKISHWVGIVYTSSLSIQTQNPASFSLSRNLNTVGFF